MYDAGIQSVNLATSGATSTLTVDGSTVAGWTDNFDFTPTAAGAGSFTVAGSGAGTNFSGLFTYTGIGNGITVNGSTSGFDQLTLTATPGNDTIDAEQTANGALGFAVSAGGALAALTVNSGAITAVAAEPIAGGSGYAPNSTFDLNVVGGGGAQGGVIEATTNASGVITAFAPLPVAQGSGYSSVPAAATTVVGGNGVAGAFATPFNLTNIKSVSISATTGQEQFLVGVAPQVTPTASLNFQVAASSIYNSQLQVKDEVSGNVVITPGIAPGSGSVTVGNFNPDTYQGVNLKIQPNLTVSDAGGTYKGAAYSATALVNGGSGLGGITPTLTYYSGTIASGTGSSTAPINAGTYTVVANFAGNATYASAFAAATFTISPKTLTASIIGTPTRAYNGTTTATLTPANFSITGLIGTQSFTITQTSGNYNGKDVTALGLPTSATTVSASLSASNFTAGSGTLASNYELPTTATGSGTITPQTLTVAIIGTPAGTYTKVYDGTTNAPLTSANFSIPGLASGEGFTITQTAGSINNKNVGSATTVTATLAASNFTPVGSTLAGDYKLPTSASGNGQITAKTLTVSGLSANNKTYNATATDTLSGTANLLQAEAAGSGSTSDGMRYVGDKVTLGGTAIGTFQSKNVGTSSVTVSGNILGGTRTAIMCWRQTSKAGSRPPSPPRRCIFPVLARATSHTTGPPRRR